MTTMTTANAANATSRDKGRSEILLESGTNELELLVFRLGKGLYGINIAKVREVILPVRVVAAPSQPPAVLGLFNLRGHVLPLVDLHRYLNTQPLDNAAKTRRIIVTEFNGARASFLVDSVEQIHRLSWAAIRPVPDTDGRQQFVLTGMTEVNGQLIMILDFESIIDHISMQRQLHIDRVENTRDVDRGAYRIWLAEDSHFIRGLMHSALTHSGYNHVQSFSNGVEAWEAIEACQGDPQRLPHLIVTDIEMPQLDGLALTRRLKSHAGYRHIPVLLFSSLITEDTRHKGEQVGADDQLAKPDLPRLVQIIDGWAAKTPARAGQA
jgi:two-component system chemotaxis response regulator CheV